MRKYLLSLAMFATTFVVSAQENQESIKPESGSFSVEVGFTPLQTNSVSLQGGQIKGAYSISDKFGVRLGLDFGTSTTTVDNNESGVAWSKTSNCTTQFTVNPGVTYSFAGTERLTPYVGAEVSFGISSKKETTEANSYKKVVKNNVSSPGFNQFGANLFTGFNYYFAQNLYVGVEFGLGFKSTNNKKQHIEETVLGKTETSESKADNSTFKFDFYANPALRLGWAF